MLVDNVSVSSVFADRGAVFTPPASYLLETTLVSYTTSSGSGTETSSGRASTSTTAKRFVNHYDEDNQDCYPSTDGTKWDDTTAVLCCPQNYASAGTALQKGQTLSDIWSAPTLTSGIPLEIPSQRPLVPYTALKAMTALHAARDISTPAAAASIPTGLLTATGTPDFTLPTNSISIPASTSTSTSTPAPPSESQGHMSTGSKIAIIIGIPLAFFSIFLLSYLLFKYRRRKLRRRHRVRHDLSSPAPTHFIPTTWASNSHAGSRAHLVPAYKESVRSKVEGDLEHYSSDSQAHLIPVSKHSLRSKMSDDPEDNAPEFYADLQVPEPVYEAEARSVRSGRTRIVEIGPSKHEWAQSKMEGIVELADTSRKSVKEWARRSVWSVRTNGTRKSRPPPAYEERSWFEDGPPSPAIVRSPVRGRFE